MKKTNTQFKKALLDFKIKSKAAKLFAILCIAGTSFANAQITIADDPSKNDEVKGLFQPVQRIITGSPISSTINAIEMVDLGFDKVLVQWNSTISYDSILFRFAPSSTINYREFGILGNPNPGSHFITGMSAQTTYDIQVATVTNGLRSSWCAPLTITTLIEPGPRLSAESNSIQKRMIFVPNPASSQTTLKFAAEADGDEYGIQLIGPSGNIVFSTQIEAVKGKNEVPMELTNFTQGLYICKLVHDNRIITEKLVVN